MKPKELISIQIALLAAAIVAGAVLGTNLTDGPRMLHRALGGSASIIGLIAAIMLMRQAVKSNMKVLAWASVAAGFVAGAAGASLKSASNYQAALMSMKLAGLIALGLAVTVLVKLKNSSAKEADAITE